MSSSIQLALESIYLDYYDGLYDEAQLKFMLQQVRQQTTVSTAVWAEWLLDAQWKHADEKDYEQKRNQIEKEKA